MPRKKRKIATTDCETDPFKYLRTPKPFVWGYYDGDSYVYFWGSNCVEQFIEFLETEPAGTIVYAHNGGKFDFFYLLEYLDKDLMIINGRIARATLFDGRIEIRDSFLILPMALKTHGKIDIDYALMEEEVREIHKNEILRYLQKDCTSLYDWVNEFINNFGLNLTLASAAFKQLKKTGYEVSNTFDEYDSLFRNYYSGGRVQCFEVGEFKEELEYVDINSAYSFAMYHNHITGSQYVEHLRLPEKENGSWFAEIDAVSYGALPYPVMESGIKKLYYPNDEKVRRYKATGWEINTGLKTNTLKIKKVYRSYRPLLTNHFRDYVDHFFAMKLESEKKGDATRRQFAKFMLNACYGKFGQDGRDFEKFCIA